MKHRTIRLAFACIILNSQFSILNSQELPQGYFRNPLDIEIGLSATFSEVRSNHFHAGIDMRTGGQEGLAVRAVADGYVSAVRVSPWGGGKMLYIKHPNGYESVYMHLSGYAGMIGRAVKNEQYRTKQYAIFKEFAPNEIPVHKGDLVARSGNSGGSGGPHLHFELRRGGRTINPLLFGLPYRDTFKPTTRGIKIYPLSGKTENSKITGIDVPANNSVTVDGPFYVGVYATDAAEGSTARNGVDRVEVYVDGNLFFAYTAEQFALDSSRMVNTLIDHDYYCAHRQAYLITRGLPGGNGPWVTARQGDGIMRLRPGSHRIGVKVYDINENVAERSVAVTVTGTGKKVAEKPGDGEPIKYDKPFSFRSLAFRVDMPAHTLYADDRMQFDVEQGELGPVLRLSPTVNTLPPNGWYTLSLLSYTNDRHAVVVRRDGKRLTAYKTTQKDGWYSASVRDFGQFELALDTVAPTVKPLSLKGKSLRVKIGDDLSGVDTYHCYLNGSWILAEYDGKSATLTIDTEGKLHSGQNELRVEVTDGAGNRTCRDWNITR